MSTRTPAGPVHPQTWTREVRPSTVVVTTLSAVLGGTAGAVLGAGTVFGHRLRPGSWWWARTLALQSPELLAGTVLALGAALLAVAAVGHRPVAAGTVPVLRRVAAVLGCQLLGVLVLGLAVNDSFDFYSSWDDLLGLGSGAVVVRESGTAGPAAVDPGAAWPGRRFALPDQGFGRIETVTVPGARTGLSETVDVYLPPQYDELSMAGRRFPVALVLSGYPGSSYALERPLALPDTMHRLQAEGRVSPMVLVMAASAPRPPWDTECTDIPGGPQVETYFAQDLPGWVAARFRVDPPGRWGVLGVSTGGFCAAKLLLAHPEVYRAGVSLSGYLSPLTDITTGDLFGGSVVLRQQNDPLWRVSHLPVPAVSLLLTTTRQEHGVYPQVTRFLRAARPPLHATALIRPTGGHNAGVWRSELPLCLQWLSSRLPAPR